MPGEIAFRTPARAVVAVACAGSLIVAGSPPAGGTRRTAARPDPAVSVIRRYVADLRRGNIDGALALRCDGLTVEPAQRSLFVSQLRRLTDRTGTIRRVVAHRIARTGIETSAPDPVEVSYRIVFRGRPHPEQLMVTALDSGVRKICGVTTPQAERLTDEGVLTDTPAGPSTAADPKELLTVAAPRGYPDASGSVPAPVAGEPAPRDGWMVVWRPKGYGGVTASATRYATPADATAVLRSRLRAHVGDSIGRFGTPAVPQARGLRVSAFAWLLVQPPDVGPYVDFLYATYGDTLVAVAAANLGARTDHRIAASLARKIAEVARSHPA